MSGDINPDVDHQHGAVDVKAAHLTSRMELFEQQEREFLEFVAETQCIDSVSEEPDQPLSGLQCLLALTEILDKAVRLRKINFDLEQRIEELDHAKLLAEVRSSIRHVAAASAEANHSGGIGKQRKSSSRQSSVVMSPTEDSSRPVSLLQRAGSTESIDFIDSLYGSSPRHESDEMKSRSLKGSILSETWGKMKGKLTSKDLTPNRVAKRHKSADYCPTIGPMIVHCASDLASSIPHTLSTVGAASSTTIEGHHSSHSYVSVSSTTTSTAVASQFTQREITISPSASQLQNDFGGVWLGEESCGADHSPTAAATATDACDSAVNVGGVWLGPPDLAAAPPHQLHVKDHHDQSVAHPASKERARRDSNGPSKPYGKSLSNKRSHGTSTDSSSTSDEPKFFPGKLINVIAGSRRKVSVHSRPDGLNEVIKNVDSPPTESSVMDSVNKSPVMRKKLPTKSSLVPALKLPDGKKQKKSDTSAVSKDFIKKMEEWNHKKEQSKMEELDKKSKQVKGSKPKTQRFKNRKRAELWKQRSKSAERAESVSRMSDEFEAKLREWSVKQGYHPTYYSEIRASHGSVDSVEEQHENITLQMQDLSDSEAFGAKDIKTLSSGDSATSLPADDLYSTERNLRSLHNISQSADAMYVRKPKSLIFGRISKSAEAVNRLSSDGSCSPQKHVPAVVRTNKYSHIDLYAQASEESLEKHLSLCHITAEGDFEQGISPTAPTPTGKRLSDVFSSPTVVALDEQLHVSSPIKTNTSTVFVFPEISLVDNQISSSSDEILDRDKILYTRKSNKPQQDTNTSDNTQSETDNSDSSAESQTIPAKDDEVLLEEALMDLKSTLHVEEDSSNTSEEFDDDTVRQSSPPPSPTTIYSNIKVSTTTNSEESILSPVVMVNSKPEASFSKPLFNISKVKKTSLESMVSAPKFAIAKDSNGTIPIEEITPDTGGHGDVSTRNLRSCEHDMKIVRGKPPLSPRNSFHSNRTKSESDTGQADSSCDINSNDLVAAPGNVNENSQLSESLYLGPDVPLKMRLKSLAKEYEMKEEKRQPTTSSSVSSRPRSATGLSLQTSHKRTRSHDFLPNSSPCSFLPKQPVSGSYLDAGKPRPVSMYMDASCSKSGEEIDSFSEVDNIYLRDRSNSTALSSQKDSVHRLRSADDYLYNHRTSYNRPSSSPTQSADDFLRRRELQEKPKIGTVQKARSLFSDNGNFNGQLGIDFSVPRAQQLS